MGKHYYYQYQDDIDEILANHRTSTQDTAIEKQALANLFKTDYGYQQEDEKQRRLAAEKAAIKTAAATTAINDIQAAQDRLRAGYQADADKIERSKLRAVSGLRLLEEYAKKHSIDITTAKFELDAYAETRTANFTGNLTDRYAALRNRSKLQGADLTASHQYETDELQKLGIRKNAEYIRKAEHYASQNPGEVFHNWNTSGAVISRQLERDSAAAKE
jgi:hypothetical protein